MKDIDKILESEDAKKQVVKELNFLTKELEKTREQSPLDFRAILRLAHLYNIFSLIEPEKLSLAEQFGKEIIELSPDNQQGYWALAQTRIYQKDFVSALELSDKAIELEPRHLRAYQIAFQISQMSGNLEKGKEIADRAKAINPAWETEFEIFN